MIKLEQVKLAVEILGDPAKRTYVDTRLETDRRRKEKYAASNKRNQEMIDVSQSNTRYERSEYCA